jgi:hypothetical protein
MIALPLTHVCCTSCTQLLLEYGESAEATVLLTAA